MTALTEPITVIGGGLAGCEAAWQLLMRGHRVRLCEMKPERFSPAHKSRTLRARLQQLASIICSRKRRRLLKEEMRRLDSLIMAAADATAVPAGRRSPSTATPSRA